MSFTTLAFAVVAFLVFLLAWRARRPAGAMIDADDPAMQAAKAEARATLPIFWAAFDARDPANAEFSLKFDLHCGEGVAELIWALDIERDQGRIFGILGNTPRDADHAEGDRVEIDPAHIVDWCFFRCGVAQGHFTTKAMFPHMPPKMVAEGKAALGWA